CALAGAAPGAVYHRRHLLLLPGHPHHDRSHPVFPGPRAGAARRPGSRSSSLALAARGRRRPGAVHARRWVVAWGVAGPRRRRRLWPDRGGWGGGGPPRLGAGPPRAGVARPPCPPAPPTRAPPGARPPG